MASRIRINFHSDSEAMINKQINMELYASYVYMAMVSSDKEKIVFLNRIGEIFWFSHFLCHCGLPKEADGSKIVNMGRIFFS